MGGATYDLTDWARAEGGGGVYQTWYPDAADLFEVRLWQAATFYWPQIETRRARWFLTHRFMIEERFQHRTSWEMSLRGSYRLGFTLPVNRFTVEPGALYLPMSAEFFTTQSDEQDVFAGKARLTIGLGDIFSKAWSVELLLSLIHI